MNIAFLSSLNPTDIHNWSGTLYYEEFYKLKYCSTVVYMVPRA